MWVRGASSLLRFPALRRQGLEADALVGALLGQREGPVGTVRAHRLEAPVLRDRGRLPGIALTERVRRKPRPRPQVPADEGIRFEPLARFAGAREAPHRPQRIVVQATASLSV